LTDQKGVAEDVLDGRTFQSLINISFSKIVGERGVGVNKFPDIAFFTREFKLHVSGNGKRQVRIFMAKFSLKIFVSYFLSSVERIIMYFSFKTAS
jgi:hypothetical protein